MPTPTRQTVRQLALLFIAVGIFAAASYYSAPLSSIELGLSMHSIVGERGGAVMPASCPSYAHSAGECNAVSASINCSPSTVEWGNSTSCTWSCNNPPSSAAWSAGSAPGVPGSSTYFNVNNTLSGTQVLYPSLVLSAGNLATGTVTYAVGCGYAWNGSSASAVSNVQVVSSGQCGEECSSAPECPFTAGGQSETLHITSGTPVTLAWACTSPSTSASGLNFATGGSVSGSVEVNPAVNTTYGVQCNAGCSQNLIDVFIVNPVISISANPTRVSRGSASTISWSSSDVVSCVVQGPGIYSTSTNGSQSTGPVDAQSKYSITCQTAGAPVSANVQVSITPAQTEI